MRPPTPPLAVFAVRSSLTAQTAEVCNAVGERNLSHYAAAPADSSHKPLKKISVHERRSLLQAFVQQYKASNGGKFPSITAAKKQVGGSYYVVKRILQEIQCESKIFASSKEINASSLKSTARARVKNHSHATPTNITSEEGAICNSEANEGLSISISEKPLSGQVLTPSNTVGAKDTENEDATFEGPADKNGSTTVVLNVTPKSTKPDDIERYKYEDQLQKRSNIWWNLRSFANGIISLWSKK